uniref:Uncharacterized protein n=1 Tax=Glossina austeni TaxID=7395 RepID=A0A1A9UKU2_GLOAU
MSKFKENNEEFYHYKVFIIFDNCVRLILRPSLAVSLYIRISIFKSNGNHHMQNPPVHILTTTNILICAVDTLKATENLKVLQYAIKLFMRTMNGETTSIRMGLYLPKSGDVTFMDPLMQILSQSEQKEKPSVP